MLSSSDIPRPSLLLFRRFEKRRHDLIGDRKTIPSQNLVRRPFGQLLKAGSQRLGNCPEHQQGLMKAARRRKHVLDLAVGLGLELQLLDRRLTLSDWNWCTKLVDDGLIHAITHTSNLTNRGHIIIDLGKQNARSRNRHA